MNLHYDSWLRRMLMAFGYQYEILKTEPLLAWPEYKLYVFDANCPDWCDADSYETVKAGEEAYESRSWANPKKTWLYGHSGFIIDEFEDSYRPFSSEYEVCKEYMKEFLDGKITCLDRIPCIGSMAELRFRMAASEVLL